MRNLILKFDLISFRWLVRGVLVENDGVRLDLILRRRHFLDDRLAIVPRFLLQRRSWLRVFMLLLRLDINWLALIRFFILMFFLVFLHLRLLNWYFLFSFGIRLSLRVLLWRW